MAVPCHFCVTAVVLLPIAVIGAVVLPLMPDDQEELSSMDMNDTAQIVFPRHSNMWSCFQGDSDCPSRCPPGHDVSITSLLHLSSLSDMKESVAAAQRVIQQNEPTPGSIIRLEELTKLHTSLNYWCCHSPKEQKVITEVVKELEWSPFDVTINATGCNLDHDGHTVYLLSLYSDASQELLFNFVRRIEKAMLDAGIPVNNPRRQLFHSTLARVVANVYPVDDVVAKVREAVPIYSRFTFNSFEIAGEIIHAKSSDSFSVF